MWLDIWIRLCGWTKSLCDGHIGVCSWLLTCICGRLVVVGLPVLKRRSLGLGDPKLSLLCLWGQSHCYFNFWTIWSSSVQNYRVLFFSMRLSPRSRTLRVLCPSPVTPLQLEPVTLLLTCVSSHWVGLNCKAGVIYFDQYLWNMSAHVTGGLLSGSFMFSSGWNLGF